MSTEQSTNLKKYKSKNPLKQLALDYFYRGLQELMVEAESVLDAGCGEGFGASRLQEFNSGLKITGIDLSLQALMDARQICPELIPTQADVTLLPFDTDQFDLVVSLETLEHLPEPDLAVKNYKRVSKRYLLLSVPNEPIFRTVRMLEGNDILKWGDHPEHINHWNFISFTRFLERNGLKVLARKVPFPFTWVIVLCEVV